MDFGLLLLFAVLILGIVGVVALTLPWERVRLRFSLRSLLIFTTLVAVVLGAVSWWCPLGIAKTTWLAEPSARAAQLEPFPMIVWEGEEFKLTFSTRRCPVQELTDTVRREQGSFPGDHGYRWEHPRNQVETTAEDEAALIERAHALQAADVLRPGTFVIRGRVEDRDGRPVPDAVVDLMDGYVYINYFQTRADGSFTMPIKAPAADGYYLTIRYGDGKRMRTPSFSLSESEPERLVLVRVR